MMRGDWLHGWLRGWLRGASQARRPLAAAEATPTAHGPGTGLGDAEIGGFVLVTAPRRCRPQATGLGVPSWR